MSIPIIKSSGVQEEFNKKKLCDSLKRAGAPENVALRICSQIDEKINPGMSTNKIYREALRYLLKENRELAARYSIRRGVASLGPAGFIFEQYIETILEAYGYKTKRNQMMRGECVTHEVDIMAMKDNVHYMIEAKYHNEAGLRTHIPVVMYAYARLLDVSAGLAKVEKGSHHNHRAWLITNTKFTDTAIAYASCKQIKLSGWDYPKKDSLEDMIVAKKLYPVTLLPSITSHMLQVLAENNILLAQDLLTFTVQDLMKLLQVDEKTAARLVKDAQMLMVD